MHKSKAQNLTFTYNISLSNLSPPGSTYAYPTPSPPVPVPPLKPKAVRALPSCGQCSCDINNKARGPSFRPGFQEGAQIGRTGKAISGDEVMKMYQKEIDKLNSPVGLQKRSMIKSSVKRFKSPAGIKPKKFEQPIHTVPIADKKVKKKLRQSFNGKKKKRKFILKNYCPEILNLKLRSKSKKRIFSRDRSKRRNLKKFCRDMSMRPLSPLLPYRKMQPLILNKSNMMKESSSRSRKFLKKILFHHNPNTKPPHPLVQNSPKFAQNALNPSQSFSKPSFSPKNSSIDTEPPHAQPPLQNPKFPLHELQIPELTLED
ncbi:unnamed protein product [Moneuplotes crassus]|uniref:Uncharacterized protein n=1 Tax=Euplotes crassus TaxID=5936 RepID=A0AAD1ULF4_EUPCR|nr:unnamed protein product [Moneuplotes crassus]